MKSYFFKVLLWIIAATMIMLGLPWLAKMILFYAIDPVFSIVMGACAGQDIKGYWYMPIGNAGLFLLGIWLYMSKDLTQFYSYAVVYLALGLVSMIISLFARKRIRTKY